MCDTKAILQLYTNVMYGDVAKHCISDLDIANRLSNMAGVCSQGPAKVVDYNDVSNRCAYLHKYAPMYTAIVKDTMRGLLSDETTLGFSLESGVLRICSLGGGPGTDVVGVLAALDGTVGASRPWYTFVSIVDHMDGWQSTFRSVVNELRRSEFSPFSSRFAEEAFIWKYVRGNLLHAKKCKVWDTVSCSSLVTMVKCLSMFRSKDVRKMIKKVFKAMSFGSSILIIDDDAEELLEITLKMAREHQLIRVFGPLRNANYSFDKLKVRRFGHTSCHQASVTSLLLMKPLFTPRSFFSFKFQASTRGFCVECGELMQVCTRCGSARDVRSSLYSVLGGLSHLSCGSEFRTPVGSRSTSPHISDSYTGSACNYDRVDSNHSLSTTNDVLLSDSVIIEVPE